MMTLDKDLPEDAKRYIIANKRQDDTLLIYWRIMHKNKIYACGFANFDDLPQSLQEALTFRKWFEWPLTEAEKENYNGA